MWGKLLGAMIGAALGLLLAWSAPLSAALALAGLALGHFAVDRQPALPRAERAPTEGELHEAQPPGPRWPSPRPANPRAPAARVPPPTAEQRVLAERLCPLFVEVARCDGPVVQSEVRVVREFFEQVLGFDEGGSEAVRVALKDALARPPGDLEALVKAARGELKPTRRLEVVDALYELGLIDAPLARSEVDALKRVVGHFNLSDEQLQQITRRHFGRGEVHLRTLGLDGEAGDDEVRAAFRRLAAEHHPDRAASLGPEHVERAAERFRAVKEAYEELRKIRGF